MSSMPSSTPSGSVASVADSRTLHPEPALARIKHHRRFLIGEDGLFARRKKHVLHVAHGFAHAILLQRFDDGWNPHRRDKADDAHDNHDFNQRERAAK